MLAGTHTKAPSMSPLYATIYFAERAPSGLASAPKHSLSNRWMATSLAMMPLPPKTRCSTRSTASTSPAQTISSVPRSSNPTFTPGEPLAIPHIWTALLPLWPASKNTCLPLSRSLALSTLILRPRPESTTWRASGSPKY